jgi:hypothetical protein
MSRESLEFKACLPKAGLELEEGRKKTEEGRGKPESRKSESKQLERLRVKLGDSRLCSFMCIYNVRN